MVVDFFVDYPVIDIVLIFQYCYSYIAIKQCKLRGSSRCCFNISTCHTKTLTTRTVLYVVSVYMVLL